jgi:hypothetical protein
MIAFLSPAKSLDFETPSPLDKSTELLFPDEAEYLAKKLRKFSVRKLKSLMDISEDLAQLNAERYAEWSLGNSDGSTKQAIFAFTGDVYQGLDATTMSPEALDYAEDHLRILSGLYGMLRPFDRIHPYRLEMGTDWAITPKKNNLYKYWKDRLTGHVLKEVDELGATFILNLASVEYAKAVDLKKTGIPVIAPKFMEDRDGRFQMISFFAKKARGMMARFALENRITEYEDLRAFDEGGYHFNESLSDISKNKWVFTRIYKPNQK